MVVSRHATVFAVRRVKRIETTRKIAETYRYRQSILSKYL